MILSFQILPLVLCIHAQSHFIGKSERMEEIDSIVSESCTIFEKYDKEFREDVLIYLKVKHDSIVNSNPDTLNYPDFEKYFSNYEKRINAKDSSYFYVMHHFNNYSMDSQSVILNHSIGDCEFLQAFFYKNELKIISLISGCYVEGVYFYNEGQIIYSDFIVYRESGQGFFNFKHYFNKRNVCFVDHSKGELTETIAENLAKYKKCRNEILAITYQKRMEEEYEWRIGKIK